METRARILSGPFGRRQVLQRNGGRNPIPVWPTYTAIRKKAKAVWLGSPDREMIMDDADKEEEVTRLARGSMNG